MARPGMKRNMLNANISDENLLYSYYMPFLKLFQPINLIGWGMKYFYC